MSTYNLPKKSVIIHKIAYRGEKKRIKYKVSENKISLF